MLFVLLLSICLVGFVSATWNMDINNINIPNGISIQSKGEAWNIIDSTGSFNTYISDSEDKKTHLGWYLKDGLSCGGSIDCNTRSLYNCERNQMLDDKNKPIVLKYETNKIPNTNELDRYSDGYFIKLTDASAVNINSCINLNPTVAYYNQTYFIYNNEDRGLQIAEFTNKWNGYEFISSPTEISYVENGDLIKTSAYDYVSKEDSLYQKVYVSNQRIIDLGDNKFELNSKYLGKSEEGLNKYDKEILDINELCKIENDCKYTIEETTYNKSYSILKDVCTVYEVICFNETEEYCIEPENEFKECLEYEPQYVKETNTILNKSILTINFTGIYDSDLDYIYIDPYYYSNGTEILETDFYSTWNTSKISTGSSNSTSISLPLDVDGTYSFLVDWGDGNVTYIESWDSVNKTHDYLVEGTFDIVVSGTINGFRFNNGLDKEKIINIAQWGSLNVGNKYSYFYGCSNLNSNATDSLDLTGTTNLYRMFGYSSFNGNVTGWDTSKVTSMNSMFNSASAFNQDLNDWDTSNVLYMQNMFKDASAFNGNISSWNTSKVTTIDSMFLDALSFNQSLNDWDTSKVTVMDYAFRDAPVFNGNISKWNTSKVTTMKGLFINTDFNQDLNDWDTSKVTDMNNMFRYAYAFNGNISNWDTSKVTNMDYMFYGAYTFNGNVSSWNTSKVTSMSNMFYGAYAFNQDLSNWDTSKVTSMTFMFRYANVFNGNISGWDTSSATSMRYMFYNTNAFNQDLNDWDTSKVTNMNYMFYDAYAFNQDISGWNVSSVGTMTNMFSATSNLSTLNYDKLLMGWNNLPVLQPSVNFNAGNTNYSLGLPNESRQDIIDTYSWTITDGGTTGSYYYMNLTIYEPANLSSWDIRTVNINYTINDYTGLNTCWYSEDYGETNHTINCNENITTVNWDGGMNNITVYSNDGFDNIAYDQVSFTVNIDTTFPTLNNLRNFTQTNTIGFSESITASDDISIDTYSLNDTSVFSIDNNGLIINTTSLSEVKFYPLQIIVNDTSGNNVTGDFWINITSETTRYIQKWRNAITGDDVCSISSVGNLACYSASFTNDVSISGNLNVTGNITLGQKITFAFEETIDNIIDGWIRITGNLNVTENLNVDGNFSAKIPYGMFSSNISQVVQVAETVYTMNFSHVEDNYLMGLENYENITIQQSGDYMITLSGLFVTDSNNKHFEMFPQTTHDDGVTFVNVPRSNTLIEVENAGTHGLISVSFILDLNAGDKFRIMYSSDDAGSMTVWTAGHGVGVNAVPETPSMVMTVSKVSEITD